MFFFRKKHTWVSLLSKQNDVGGSIVVQDNLFGLGSILYAHIIYSIEKRFLNCQLNTPNIFDFKLCKNNHLGLTKYPHPLQYYC